MKKNLCLATLLFLAGPLLSGEPAGAAVDQKAGYALLESVGRTFHEMAVSGTGGIETMTGSIHQFMAEARKAREQKQIDAVFFSRFARILAIIKIAMAPDPEGILVPMFNDELARFVREVLGEEYKGSGPQAIGQVAGAIADELINLHLYLDNIETKEKLRKAWDQKMSGASKKEG